MAVPGIEDDCRIRVSAEDKQDMVLHIQSQPGRAAALAGEIIVRHHFEGVGVDQGRVVFDCERFGQGREN